MTDRMPIRDRCLVLRILVPGLEASLRDKMKEMEETARGSDEESILDLGGVTCEPTKERNRTLWNFHCDGATYPAKLVNLPCPVEVHKTYDHAYYHKSADIAQMLIVYEDEMALEEENEKPVDGFPSYHSSGITPPLKNVVERRFANREHSSVLPPRSAVMHVEQQLLHLLEKVKDEKKRTKNVTSTNKIITEIEEDVVDYEPWMDDFGKTPEGIEFDMNDKVASVHPEIWLKGSEIREIVGRHGATKKKKKNTGGAKRTNVAQRQEPVPVDDVTQAALNMSMDAGHELDGFNMDDDDFFKDLGEDDLGDLGDFDLS